MFRTPAAALLTAWILATGCARVPVGDPILFGYGGLGPRLLHPAVSAEVVASPEPLAGDSVELQLAKRELVLAVEEMTGYGLDSGREGQARFHSVTLYVGNAWTSSESDQTSWYQIRPSQS